jgi:hypothetical protein
MSTGKPQRQQSISAAGESSQSGVDIPVNEGQIDNPDSDDDRVSVDVDELKVQLGIDKMMESINAIAMKLNQNGVAEYPGSGALDTRSEGSVATAFDPTMPVDLSEASSVDRSNEEEFTLPSLFEETEKYGPEIQEVIAQRVNDACSKKPLESKLKELQEKYKTPSNCQHLCVPKVNLELWFDLPKESKNRDLGMQELQKSVVKAAQPILQLFNSALKAKQDRSNIDPMVLLPMLADAVTFLGHASYLTSLKRKEMLKPDIAKPYQAVCSKSQAITSYLFGDELPKHIKEIGEVNKISRRVTSRSFSSPSRVGKPYKSSGSYQGSNRRAFLGYRGRGSSFRDRNQPSNRAPTRFPNKDKA